VDQGKAMAALSARRGGRNSGEVNWSAAELS